MISTIIPAQNLWENVLAAVRLARRDPCVEEIIVVDDGSIDELSELDDSGGLRRIQSILPGKGASMEDGLRAAQHEIVLFLDGSLEGLAPDLIHRMTEPIRERWAAFSRPACVAPVATLTTQLALHSFFPELDSYSQPFSGIVAARRELFETFSFESDHGVHIGLLIDAVMSGEALAEVDIGQVSCDAESLDVVGDMATQVLRTVIERAAKYGRLSPRPMEELRQIHRQIGAEVAIALARPQRPKGLALFAMDGVLLQEPFIPQLARRMHRPDRLVHTLDDSQMESDASILEVAALFAQVPKAIFEDVAHHIPLTDGARETVLGLRKAGFRVAVVTDGFHVAADVVRRRVGADFAVGHLIQFRHGVATGEVTMSPAMTIVQHGGDFVATASYKSEDETVSWRAEGKISRSGHLTMNLVHTHPHPPDQWLPQTRTAVLRLDGRSLEGYAAYEGGRHKFTWRLVEPREAKEQELPQ